LADAELFACIFVFDVVMRDVRLGESSQEARLAEAGELAKFTRSEYRCSRYKYAPKIDGNQRIYR
jgi:hypothetical protein